MTPEGEIEAYLKRRVLAEGGTLRKVRWLDRNGAPDRIIWWPGPRMAFVEVKAFGKKPSALQSLEHARMRGAGFEVFVIDSGSAVENFIRHMTT